MFMTLRRAAFWGAAAVSMVGAIRPLPFPELGPSSDKVAHILAFATLSVLGRFAYGRINPLHLGGVLALYGVLIETIQAVPTLNRDSSGMDIIADWAAIAAALLLLEGGQRLFSRVLGKSTSSPKIDMS